MPDNAPVNVGSGLPVATDEIPSALTGTVTKTASSATVAGSGTAFLTELSVGQVISIPGTATERGIVTAIASDTSLTVADVFANTASGQAASRVQHYQRFKTGFGGDGIYIEVDYTNPLPVSGGVVPCYGTMTRTADTNVYAAGDGVTTATSSPAAMSVTSAARVAAGGGTIIGGKLTKSTTGTTNAQFRGWLYQDTPTAIPNDNAAFTAAVHADYQKFIGTFTADFTLGIVGSDGVSVTIVLSRTNIGFKLASGTTLIVILEARAAYTPGNAEIFRLALDISQN